MVVTEVACAAACFCCENAPSLLKSNACAPTSHLSHLLSRLSHLLTSDGGKRSFFNEFSRVVKHELVESEKARRYQLGELKARRQRAGAAEAP